MALPDAPLNFVRRVSGGRAKRLLPRRSNAGRGDAVAFLEIKSLLSTMLCYWRAQAAIKKKSPISLLKGAKWGLEENDQWVKRTAGPFVTIAAEPDEDAAWVEQLRGHTVDHLFKNNRRGWRLRHFLGAVCRRRWASARRPQAPQRSSDLRTSARGCF